LSAAVRDDRAQAVLNAQVARRLPLLPPVMRTEYDPATDATPEYVRVPVEVVRTEPHWVPLGSVMVMLTI